MIEFAVKPPTLPISFHKLLKVDAVADEHDRQVRDLLDVHAPFDRRTRR